MEQFSFSLEACDASALQRIVLYLAGLGYQEERICKRLDLSDLTDLQWRAVSVLRKEYLNRRDLLDLAIDLFLFQGRLAVEELNRLFCETDRDFLVRIGLLRGAGAGFVRATASLFPVGDRLIFSDPAWPMLTQPEPADLPPDQVMYVGKDSHWLARATQRDPIGSALDLCTGSGVHAILAAKHATRVVAVDISKRATLCSRFNALASGDANIDVRMGDLYEPVGAEAFDLITANPPFVPAPVQAMLYRDGGCSGEEVQRRIIAGLPQHLAKNGTAQIVTEFGLRDNEPLSERLRAWLNGAPMDISILFLREHSPMNYAIGHANGNGTYDAFLESVDNWYANLKANGYTKIVSVLLAFQWSEAEPWTRNDEVLPPSRPAGSEIKSMFLTERMVRKPDFIQLLEQSTVRLAGPIALVESRVLGNAAQTNFQAKVLGRAFLSWQKIEPVEKVVMDLLSGIRTVSDLLARTSERKIEKSIVLAALQSLARRGLVIKM